MTWWWIRSSVPTHAEIPAFAGMTVVGSFLRSSVPTHAEIPAFAGMAVVGSFVRPGFAPMAVAFGRPGLAPMMAVVLGRHPGLDPGALPQVDVRT